MKSWIDLSRNISGRFGVMLMLVCALVLSSCATSYASIQTPTSKTATTSPTKFYRQSKNLLETDGIPSALGRRSTERRNQFTNFTGSETQPFSATNRRLNYGSADRIRNQFDLSASLIISTSVNSPTTRASRCESFSLTDISKTGRLCSDANQATNWRTSARLPERNLKILPTGKQRQSFKPPSSESEIGRTSEVFRKPESNLPESWQHWTRGQPRFAKS